MDNLYLALLSGFVQRKIYFPHVLQSFVTNFVRYLQKIEVIFLLFSLIYVAVIPIIKKPRKNIYHSSRVLQFPIHFNVVILTLCFYFSIYLPPTNTSSISFSASRITRSCQFPFYPINYFYQKKSNNTK